MNPVTDAMLAKINLREKITPELIAIERRDSAIKAVERICNNKEFAVRVARGIRVCEFVMESGLKRHRCEKMIYLMLRDIDIVIDRLHTLSIIDVGKISDIVKLRLR